MAATTSPSCRRPASASPTPAPASCSNRPPNAASPSNTVPVPSPSPSPPAPTPTPTPTPPSSYFPSPQPPPSTPRRRSSSRPVSRSSSPTSISSLSTASQGSQRPRPSQNPTQFIMLHERPHSPSTLTSSLAPPSLIPMTAAGINVKSTSVKGSRKTYAGMKLSMLPNTIPSNPTSSSAAAPSSYSFHHHHDQAYSRSLSAQQQLQLHQKEIIHQATRATGIPQHLLSTGPMSPRLIPLGSPGPVTPLTLEDGSDGFFASSHGFGHQQLGQQLSIVASGQRGGL